MSRIASEISIFPLWNQCYLVSLIVSYRARDLAYNLATVNQDLNQVAPHDWATFFQDRIASLQPHADLDGIVRAGYKLVYTDQPSTAEQMLSDPANPLYAGEDYWYSVGLRVDDSGTLMDVRWGAQPIGRNLHRGRNCSQ
jgi:predicted metalloprotease with PDZ domain